MNHANNLLSGAIFAALLGATSTAIAEQPYANDSLVPRAGTSSVAEKAEPYAERAGQKIDAAKEKASRAFDRTEDKAERVAEKAAHKAEHGAERADRKAERVAEKADRKAERVAEKTDHKAERVADKAEHKKYHGEKDISEKRAAMKYDADNSAQNVRDASGHTRTADDQAMSGTDNEVIATVRRNIVANDQLSTNGKNVKIVAEQGVITLRGPVASADERAWIEATAQKSVPSNFRIQNQLDIVQD